MIYPQASHWLDLYGFTDLGQRVLTEIHFVVTFKYMGLYGVPPDSPNQIWDTWHILGTLQGGWKKYPLCSSGSPKRNNPHAEKTGTPSINFNGEFFRCHLSLCEQWFPTACEGTALQKFKLEPNRSHFQTVVYLSIYLSLSISIYLSMVMTHINHSDSVIDT